ncbi:MAG TPA: FAD-dependent oxidoreductase [Solirubrobacteraceae bacterium]|jgi:thioredoxin reductase|nr:FAD-dependent oxidoreductase [Solirubrobacteraceae bacterium]
MSDPDTEGYDVVVVGAGIAGLTTAATAAGLGLRVVVLEQLGPGGQFLETAVVDDVLLGEQPAMDLAAAVMERAMDAGATLEFAAATKLVTGDRHTVEAHGATYSAAAVVLAMGSTSRRVDIPGENEFAGRGVSYCVACDGPLFSGQPVVMLGAGRYAAREAHELRQFVSELTVVSLDDGRSDTRWVESLEVGDNLRLIADAKPVSIDGDGTGVSGIRLAAADREWQLEARGIFVCAGRVPAIDLVRSSVDLDAAGRIVVDASLNVGTPGLYAVGDIRTHSPERLISAAADGVTAATAIASRIAHRRTAKGL